MNTVTDLLDDLAGNATPWMRSGSCARTGEPDLWFPAQGRPDPLARRTCAACPVLDECRAYGIAHPDEHGIWGGLNAKQRRRAHHTTTDQPLRSAS